MITGRFTKKSFATASSAAAPRDAGAFARAKPLGTHRAILITGGAPRIAVDAIRYLTVQTTGSTALSLHERLAGRGIASDLLLGVHAAPQADQARRFDSRADLEREMQAWIAANPDGVVVMAAAVNDYVVSHVESIRNGKPLAHNPEGKVPSGADELVIRLKPASKVIDRLRAWGLHGPLVAFKYEAAESVVASARSLQGRIGAQLVVANSLDGAVQALVDPIRVQTCVDREALLVALTERLALMATR